jgi:hypothetical protein
MRDKLQRFELKYIVEESVALSVRDHVSTHLELDEFSARQPNYSYPVHSLYLDSDDLLLYQSAINSEKNRFKLRLRFYNSEPDAPVFFEIKRRVDNAIRKQRGGVKRAAVDWRLAGHLPAPEHLASKEPKHFFALQRFCALMKRLEARPKVHVAYLREAWLPSDANSVRVTLDRQVCADPEPGGRLCLELRNPVLVFDRSVILEIKFTGRFPEWLTELVRVHNLRPCSAAKYVDGRQPDGQPMAWRPLLGNRRQTTAGRACGGASSRARQAGARLGSSRSPGPPTPPTSHMTMLVHLNRLATAATGASTLVLSLTTLALAGLVLYAMFRGAGILTVERGRPARWLRHAHATLLASNSSLKRQIT